MSGRPKIAMVLAGGRGLRMRPITNTIPKPLVKVAGRTLLDRGLDTLAAAGVEKAVVNVHHFPEQIVAHVVVQRVVQRGHLVAPPGLDLVAELFVPAVQHRAAPQVVERPVFRGAHQPRGGIARHAFGRPLLEGRHQCVLGQFLRHAHIANQACQCGDDFRGFHPPHRFDGAMDVGSRHGLMIA